MSRFSEETMAFVRDEADVATSVDLRRAAAVIDAASNQSNAETEYGLAESLRKLAGLMDEATIDAVAWQRRALRAEEDVKVQAKVIGQLDMELGTVTGERDRIKALVADIEKLIDEANAAAEIDVVFDYGEHGAGGLTPSEATRLAVEIETNITGSGRST